MWIQSRSSSFSYWGLLEVNLSGCKVAFYIVQGQLNVVILTMKLEEMEETDQSSARCQSTAMLIDQPDREKGNQTGVHRQSIDPSLQLARIRWVVLQPVCWRSCAVMVMVLNCYISALRLTSFQQESKKTKQNKKLQQESLNSLQEMCDFQCMQFKEFRTGLVTTLICHSSQVSVSQLTISHAQLLQVVVK